MKHLHFAQSLEPLRGGGLGSSAVALHRHMLERGVDSALCSTYAGTPVKPAEATFEFRRLKPDFLYYSPKMHRQAVHLVEESNVVHGHGLYVGTNYVFGRQARRQGKSLVYHAHGMFEPYILRRSRWKKRLVHQLFEDANINHVCLWRALTAAEADQIRALGHKAAIVVAPNGLNLAEYPRPADGLKSIATPLIPNLVKTKKRLLFLGRLHPKKGLDLLVPVWSRLEAQRKDWELVVAGPDELNHRTQIQELAASLGMEREILFTGAVTGSAKIALLYSADIFVLPSYSEGLPMSLLEAMACEVPVVATYACNCPDVYAAGAGWGCEPTADSVAEALKAAMQASESERRQRGCLGRQLVQRSYEWDQITRTILQACAEHC
ncbi:MAG TPA: glycosyltransferase [Verrucomicrobiae bacterium]|nr:glycosyltransferase [Verrucomicrobiae bacterium]